MVIRSRGPLLRPGDRLAFRVRMHVSHATSPGPGDTKQEQAAPQGRRPGVSLARAARVRVRLAEREFRGLEASHMRGMHRPSHELVHFRGDVGHPTVVTIDPGGSVVAWAREASVNQGASDSNGSGRKHFSWDRA